MANLSNVDAAKIRAAAQKLSGIEADIQGNVGKISDAMDRLDKGWTSEVKTQFLSVWQEDAEALVEMMGQYMEINELLTQAAQEFEQTENDMVSEVGKLK